jgi:hypothetical protein
VIQVEDAGFKVENSVIEVNHAGFKGEIAGSKVDHAKIKGEIAVIEVNLPEIEGAIARNKSCRRLSRTTEPTGFADVFFFVALQPGRHDFRATEVADEPLCLELVGQRERTARRAVPTNSGLIGSDRVRLRRIGRCSRRTSCRVPTLGGRAFGRRGEGR